MAQSTEQQLKAIYGKFLFFSYAYYKHDKSFIPDETFDKMCKALLLHWDKFDHRFKHLVSKEDLEAGTGYAIQYPKGMVEYFDREMMRIRSDPIEALKKWL